ncbi:magnesium transporter [Wolbachia endosymbiont (group B) of Episyrphus balteatus]|uniref:MgtE intracellular N domain protein n=1 Tax=Wolbachia endosymbiont (group B) of Episyrphus balteatus TaxID=2954009 RepID=UPI002226299D|nr:MgtE intracellular N domain protein [Wolbachia endosymbiont (group B) of Episyrphus balteatus]
MSGKKHVFKMVPGQQFSCGSSGYEVYSNIKNPQSMKKVKLISLSEEDDTLELSIKFCSDFLDRLGMYCVEEKQNRYILDDQPGYYKNSNSFAYDNDRLVKLSLNWGTGDKTGYHNFVSEELKYKYLTWEESGLGDDKYYFSDKEGNIIDSPDNKILQYSMPHHDTAKVIEDITSSKIPKSVLISSEFAKTFFKGLTENQLKTLANTLSNGQLQKIIPELSSNQLQVLAKNLTDGQFLALVDHLTNHQLQALTHTLDSKKLGIIVPLLNENQVTNLVKDFNLDQVKQIFPHLKMDQFEMMIKTMSNDQFVELIKNANEKMINTILDDALKNKLPILVKTLEEDTLHNLINKLDHEKLAIVARELTDSDKIKIVIKSLVDKPEKLQAFAHSMSHEQFKELLDNLGAEELKDIIHKLPHEKVMSVIGNLGSKDQSNAIIDELKGKLDEQSKHNEEIKEMLKQIKDDMPGTFEAPDFITTVEDSNDSMLLVW